LYFRPAPKHKAWFCLKPWHKACPLVSTAELGTSDVLQEGLGVWISQEEVTDFSGKVVKLLGDAQARKDLGNAGRDYALEWSAGKQAERLLCFYQSVLGPR
jgi:1,2-diacylglycerol 3-alpha-glucosyltransferase